MKEKTVSDVLAKMSKAELKAIDTMCDYASGKSKTKTPEAISAALLIRDKLTKEKQKVSYYLIGEAEKDRITPLILSLYLAAPPSTRFIERT